MALGLFLALSIAICGLGLVRAGHDLNAQLETYPPGWRPSVQSRIVWNDPVTLTNLPRGPHRMTFAWRADNGAQWTDAMKARIAAGVLVHHLNGRVLGVKAAWRQGFVPALWLLDVDADLSEPGVYAVWQRDICWYAGAPAMGEGCATLPAKEVAEQGENGVLMAVRAVGPCPGWIYVPLADNQVFDGDAVLLPMDGSSTALRLPRTLEANGRLLWDVLHPPDTEGAAPISGASPVRLGLELRDGELQVTGCDAECRRGQDGMEAFVPMAEVDDRGQCRPLPAYGRLHCDSRGCEPAYSYWMWQAALKARTTTVQQWIKEHWPPSASGHPPPPSTP